MNSKNKTNLWVNKSFLRVFFHKFLAQVQIFFRNDMEKLFEWKSIFTRMSIGKVFRDRLFCAFCGAINFIFQRTWNVESKSDWNSLNFQTFPENLHKTENPEKFRKHNPINPIWNQNCKNILDYVKTLKQTFIRDSNTCFSALIIWNIKFG